MMGSMSRITPSLMARPATQRTISTSSKLRPRVNRTKADDGSYNYGQFLTIWDRIGGSYRKPDAEWFNKQTKTSESTWQSGIKEMERIQKTVEDDDDRTYSTVTKKNV